MLVWFKNKQLPVFLPSVNHDLSQLQKLRTLIFWLSVYACLLSTTADLRESVCLEEYFILNYNIFLWKKYFWHFPAWLQCDDWKPFYSHSLWQLSQNRAADNRWCYYHISLNSGQGSRTKWYVSQTQPHPELLVVVFLVNCVFSIKSVKYEKLLVYLFNQFFSCNTDRLGGNMSAVMEHHCTDTEQTTDQQTSRTTQPTFYINQIRRGRPGNR